LNLQNRTTIFENHYTTLRSTVLKYTLGATRGLGAEIAMAALAAGNQKEQKAGHIINVSSVAGHKVGPENVVYAASKHAVRVISEGLRQEVKPYNIRTTVISPGAVATELPNSISDPDIVTSIQKFYEEIAIPADSFARAVAFAMSQPEDVDVNEILFRPIRQRCNS
jgi:NADP-dependent 3-hydroxy acid dehydrogenase YdfG